MKKYRNIDKGGNLFSAIEHQQMVSNEIVGILKLRDLIDWEIFRETIERAAGYADGNWNKGGRPPFDPVLGYPLRVVWHFSG